MTAAAIVCTSCGAEAHRADARYCDACGSPLTGPGRHAEFKQVTVLFADVVGSMDIAAAVGAERLREIMASLVGRGAAVVQRYSGTMDKVTGDGLMAVFGAPVALEDHAIRACLAALDLQREIQRLADEVQRRDGIDLQMRVGLNSGQVVAGEMGSGVPGFTAIGEQVGLAQRMESVAPPGGVMLSASTARLVENTAVLADLEQVRIKGHDEPVSARRLLAVVPGHEVAAGTESTLVGRRWEMAVLEAMVEQVIGGRGGVVGVAGPPGIGKSRAAREAAALATDRRIEVVWAYCESHARDIPFHVVTNLLRTVMGVTDLDGAAARARVRERVPDADPQDLVLLDDLLGTADPDVSLPIIDPDARRRRLTALINAASLARTTPALFIIEDAHWIDAVSESMLADFLSVVPQTPSMALITYRPEYEGALTRAHGAQTIALAPLGDSETAAILGELLGPDPSVGELGVSIVSRVGGNPFFAEEIRAGSRRARRAAREAGRLRMPDGCDRGQRACHLAGDDRRSYRPSGSSSQTCVERSGGDRLALRHRTADQSGCRAGRRGAGQSRADRSGEIHRAGGVCVPPSADPRGGLRVAVEIGSRRMAPAAGRRDPRAAPALGG
jgi:adenylate cyclase